MCLSPDRDSIETAFMQWWPLANICEEFQVRRQHLQAHASVFEWERRKLENMEPMYVRLLNDTMDQLDLRKVPQKEILRFVGKLSAWMDRLQGKVVDKREVDERRSVVFVSVPLPGGSKPLLPEGKQSDPKAAPAIEATFDEPAREADRAVSTATSKEDAAQDAAPDEGPKAVELAKEPGA